jgi:hypothetical protein
VLTILACCDATQYLVRVRVRVRARARARASDATQYRANAHAEEADEDEHHRGAQHAGVELDRAARQREESAVEVPG